jgi:phosphoribosyl-ATP pyrophosphohydrolase
MNEITKRLPVELVRYIKEYIPKKEFAFTNRENYNLYHILIKPCIKDYESYIRYMIRQDNEFVFKKIIEENYRKWYEIRQYKYKNMIFNNYLYFVINFCIENDSNNCRKVISDFLKEHGLGKNLHKKNVVKYIKWKN